MNNVKYALQHNIGLGGAAVVGIYKLGFAKSSPAAASEKSASSSSDLSLTTTQHKSGKFFEDIELRLKQDKSLVSKLNAIIEFNIGVANNKTISYIVDVKNPPGSVKVNTDGKSCRNLFKFHTFLITFTLFIFILKVLNRTVRSVFMTMICSTLCLASPT